MDFETVKKVREAQKSAQARFDEEHLLTEEKINDLLSTSAAKELVVRPLTEVETMIFKMRSELIDYIVAHGLVDGLNWDGENRPTVNGKIVITKEMIDDICHRLGYQKEKITIVDVWFNGVSVLDPTDRTAKITITPEDIKTWYESNPDTNAFTDAEKTLLASLPDTVQAIRDDLTTLTGRVDSHDTDIANLETSVTNLEKTVLDQGLDIEELKTEVDNHTTQIEDLQKNKVDDVQINDVSTLDTSTGKVIAKITRQQIKQAYEDNPDTNAFDDAAMKKLASVEEGAQKNAVTDVLIDDDSVLDHERHAEITGEMLKKSIEKVDGVGSLSDTLQSVDVTTQSGETVTVKPVNHKITYSKGANISTITLGEDNIKPDITVESYVDGEAPQATVHITEEQMKDAFPGLGGGGTGNVDDVQVDGKSVVEKRVAKITMPITDVTLDGQSVLNNTIAAFTGKDIYNSIKELIPASGVSEYTGEMKSFAEGGTTSITIPLPATQTEVQILISCIGSDGITYEGTYYKTLPNTDLTNSYPITIPIVPSKDDTATNKAIAGYYNTTLSGELVFDETTFDVNAIKLQINDPSGPQAVNNIYYLGTEQIDFTDVSFTVTATINQSPNTILLNDEILTPTTDGATYGAMVSINAVTDVKAGNNVTVTKDKGVVTISATGGTSSGVSDVLYDGTSVVKDGVASVPKTEITGTIESTSKSEYNESIVSDNTIELTAHQIWKAQNYKRNYSSSTVAYDTFRMIAGTWANNNYTIGTFPLATYGQTGLIRLRLQNDNWTASPYYIYSLQDNGSSGNNYRFTPLGMTDAQVQYYEEATGKSEKTYCQFILYLVSAFQDGVPSATAGVFRAMIPTGTCTIDSDNMTFNITHVAKFS